VPEAPRKVHSRQEEPAEELARALAFTKQGGARG
jgi:hypothetical protein